MAYQELKSESYQLLGGMNSKASVYNNNPMEFRELTNFQFSQPGAIDKRQGTTLYAGGSIIGPVTGLYEYSKITGGSYLIQTISDSVYKVTPSGQTLFYGYSGVNNGLFDFITSNNTLFMTTAGSNSTYPLSGVRKFDGSSLYLYGLPPGEAAGSTFVFAVSPNTGGQLVGTGVTTTFHVGYGYVNTLGYFGPIGTSYTVTINGTTQNSLIFTGMIPPQATGDAQWGATYIAVYCSLPNQTVPFYATFSVISAHTLVLGDLNLSSLEANYNFFSPSVFPQGNGAPLTFSEAFFPQFVELYSNRLFFGGIYTGTSVTGLDENSFRSSIFYSTLQSPEEVTADQSIEVRTNDGDAISGLRSYNGGLIITKYKSLHQLSGSDPSNFLLQEITAQYGCISNRAIVSFNNVIWMLDTKGIIEYTGANVSIISTKMDPIFQRMNLAAAKDNAWGVFYKEINQVWFGFPVDDSTVNNMIVVYDLVAQAWTKYEGLNIKSPTIAQQTLSKPTVFFGGYSGSVGYFGASFTNDYGSNGITCLFQTPYYAPTGHTVERQYRRFYLDVTPIVGSSTPINMQFLPDFGSTVGSTAVIYQAPFQTRVDFGVPAKSLSAVGTFFSASLPISVNGYTFESRFQRNV